MAGGKSVNEVTYIELFVDIGEGGLTVVLVDAAMRLLVRMSGDVVTY